MKTESLTSAAVAVTTKSMLTVSTIFEKFALPVAYLIITIGALFIVYNDGKFERERFLILFEKQSQIMQSNTETLHKVADKLDDVADKMNRTHDTVTAKKK
jgi:hypothetical protein